MRPHPTAVLRHLTGKIGQIVFQMKAGFPVEDGDIQAIFREALLTGLVNPSDFDDTPPQLSYAAFVDAALEGDALDSSWLQFGLGVLCIILSENTKQLEFFMRRDEAGNPCPSTLGEYRRLCYALAPNSRAVEFLDEHIAQSGPDEEVMQPDSQMRFLLMPLLIKPRTNGEVLKPSVEPTEDQLKTGRRFLYEKVSEFVAELIGEGREVMLDINFDPELGPEDWKVVFQLIHPRGESTFLLYERGGRIVHLSTSAGKEVEIDGLTNFRAYVRGFFD